MLEYDIIQCQFIVCSQSDKEQKLIHNYYCKYGSRMYVQLFLAYPIPQIFINFVQYTISFSVIYSSKIEQVQLYSVCNMS